MREKTFDKERIHLNLAKIKKGGINFEIDIVPSLAVEFKQGKSLDIREILTAQKIFSDAKKGLLASESSMNEIFETTDVLDIASIILKEGEIQLTGEYRQKLRDDKRKKIISLIHRNGVDPRTNAPLPITRIENAFEQTKIKVNEFKSAEDQVQEIIKSLKNIMPIKFEIKEIELIIPREYSSKSLPILKQFGTVLRSNWNGDGSFSGIVEIPGGLEEDFFDKLNSITHGNMQSKITQIR